MSDSLHKIDSALLTMQRALTDSFGADDSILGRVEMSTLWVLDAVWRDQGEDLLTVKDIADSLRIAPSTASRFVARAQIGGVVVKIRDPVDARHVSVALTDRGEALARSAVRYRLRFLRRLMQNWSAEDCDDFAVLLSRFASSLVPPDPETPERI